MSCSRGGILFRSLEMWLEMYTASEGSLVTEAMERYNSFFLKMLLLIEQ